MVDTVQVFDKEIDSIKCIYLYIIESIPYVRH